MKNIVLIGMPGSGKSTCGLSLARHSDMIFIDTDEVIENNLGRKLTDILSIEGIEYFKQREEEAGLEVSNLSGYVIATGGSMVYQEKAMTALKKNSVVVYLYNDAENLKKRTRNKAILMGKNKTLNDLFEERKELYEKYADVTIDCNGLNVNQILKKLKENSLVKEVVNGQN